MKRRACLIPTALLVTIAFSSPAAAGPGQSLTVTMVVRSLYDDNFLQYSDNQLADFDSGVHPLRYSIQSTEDEMVQPSVALTWELDEGGGRRHALRLRGDGDFHSRNGTADDRAASAQWTEKFPHERRLSLGYYRVDDFYLRQLRDEDIAAVLADLRYRRAQFDLQIASASWHQLVARRLSAGLSYQFENRRYVPEFRERDSETHQGEVRLECNRLPHRGVLSGWGGYRVSEARASDGDEVGGVPDDDDVSYHGAIGGLGARMEFKRSGSWRFGGDVAYKLETRRYESTLPTDRYHFGRNDMLNAVELGLRLVYHPHWSVRGFYRLENNGAHLGTNAPPTSDSGSYHVNQAGLAIEWTGHVWRASTEEEDE